MRRHPLDVEQAGLAGPHGLNQGDQGDLGCVPLMVEHRLTGEEPADGHSVQTGHQTVVRGPRLDAVRPAQLVQPLVGAAHLAVDPRSGPPRVGAGGNHLLEGGAEADIIAPTGALERPAHDQAVQRDHPARVGRPPGDGAARRHREQAATVRGEEAAGLQVGTDADDFPGPGQGRLRPCGTGELPPGGRRLEEGAAPKQSANCRLYADFRDPSSVASRPAPLRSDVVGEHSGSMSLSVRNARAAELFTVPGAHPRRWAISASVRSS